MAAPPTGPAPHAGYYQYRAPSQPTYTPFYPGHSGTGSAAAAAAAVTAATTTAAKISYPTYSQSSYAHQSASYQQQSYKAPPTATPTVTPTASSLSGGGGSGQPSYAPAIQQYARQKVQGRGAATVGNSSGKKPFMPPSPAQLLYCETCKISCCSAAVSLPLPACWWALPGPAPSPDLQDALGGEAAPQEAAAARGPAHCCTRHLQLRAL